MTKEQDMMGRLDEVYLRMDTTDEYGDSIDSTPYAEAIAYAKEAIRMQEKLKQVINHYKSLPKDVAQQREMGEKIADLECFLVDAEPRTLADVDIRCDGDIMVEADHICFSWECWFDVDRMFGTNTRDDDDKWVNFYTSWYPDGRVEAIYMEDSSSICHDHAYELSEKEKEALLEKMEAYCKQEEGLSLSELWEEVQEEKEEEKDEI